VDFSGARHQRLPTAVPLLPEFFSSANLEAITLDIARKNSNSTFGGDESPLLARNSIIWGIFLVGVVIGFMAVYLLVAQPMFAQLGQMQRQIVALDADLQSLVGARNEAWEAGNLLSDLEGLKIHLRDARATVREIRSLRQDLLEESKNTAAASEALRSLVRLQEFALAQEDLAVPAARSLEQLAQIQNRLVQENEGTPGAEATLADLDRVRRDLTDLLSLKTQIAQNSGDLEIAKSAAGELLSLKDQIVARGQDLETARTNANRLFILKEELKAQGIDLADAFTSLDRLLAIKDKLSQQTPAVADAVQNLEILSDFQEEFAEQIRSLGRMREGLMQIVLMEGTLGRVAKLLEPLAQIANVRRLSDRELREAARSILENRATRISSKPEAPRQLPADMPADPFHLSRENEAGTTDDGESGDVPPPLPLPVTN
jgi:hypothetical protein